MGVLSLRSLEAQRALWLFWRGFLIVGLTSANVAFISHGSSGAAMATSVAISVTWWGNSQATHRRDFHGARWWYGLGAGCGTVVAITVTHLLK